MMLVYLDSAQFAWLERAISEKSSEADDFFSGWDELGASLAFSFHHAQEIAQLEDPNSIERRLAILSRFPAIRFSFQGSVSAIEEEIRAQLAGIIGEGPAPYSELRSLFFPATSFGEIQENVQDAVAGLQKSRAILTASAELENISREVSKLAQDHGVDVTEGLGDQGALKRLRENYNTMLNTIQNAETKSVVEAMFGRTLTLADEEGSLRAGVVAFLQLKGVHAVNSVPDGDLARMATFYVLARRVAVSVAAELVIPAPLMLTLANRLDPYDCPGFRLKLAVTRARRRAPKLAEPGDETDSDHLVFAPYVDLLFVDRRTDEFVRQEARRGSRLLPRNANRNLRRAATLKDVLTFVTEAKP